MWCSSRFSYGSQFLYDSYTVPAILIMDDPPGKWPRGIKNLNLLKTMLENTRKDIKDYEQNIWELSTSRKCRDLHQESIKQYEYMIEVLKKDYKEICQELDKIDIF